MVVEWQIEERSKAKITFLGLGFSASIPRSLFHGFGFGFFCFTLEIVISREELS